MKIYYLAIYKIHIIYITLVACIFTQYLSIIQFAKVKLQNTKVKFGPLSLYVRPLIEVLKVVKVPCELFFLRDTELKKSEIDEREQLGTS